MSPIRPRTALGALPAYAAGKPPTPVEGLTPYKLSSNENPWGPVPAAQQAIAEAAAGVHRYPDPATVKLRAQIAESLEVPVEDIVTGAGSLGALAQILAAFAGTDEDGAGDEVLYAWRSFEAYPILVTTAGARNVQVPNLPDGSHDLQAMLAAVTDRTRVILLCSPNNPTGPSLTQAAVDDFLAEVPEDVVVVVDEAYREFQSDPEVVDGIRTYRSHPNVVALRTFSKAHGLAGLRVGFCLAQQPVTEQLRKVTVPFAVTELAQAAAVATLRNPDQVQERVDRITSERDRVQAELERMGCWVPATQANFVWLALGAETDRFARACAAQALAVRAFAGEGVRVTIGEPEANDRFLAVCSAFSPLPSAPAVAVP
ncbi:histidinol-phosphate transaminase [Kocuria sp. JC486]|uniref:Aromatic amino acid aminotransferase n=1 Tax=Kocuria soli TaxID=2485125 RepID=A0A3N4AFK7_9MICC|nr:MULTISPECIES: histidinol-phosphate transaminase [Kocuria]NHU85086.1 histidinol-phosphate transaminase [Kocuria sp. JC486]ROZ65669.1 histidinol-phosphate transaminase [Kocuria soli]